MMKSPAAFPLSAARMWFWFSWRTIFSAIEQVIDAGKQAGPLVILNPAPWQPVEHALLRKVDLLTPNATEAGLMTGRRVGQFFDGRG